MSVPQMRRNVAFATRARFSLHQIDSGDTLRGEPIDRDGEAANQSHASGFENGGP
jgi:hypothetical protein